MLWMVSVILVAGWLLGLAKGTTVGGLIHVLPVTAVVILLAKTIRGPKPDCRPTPPSHRRFAYGGILFKSKRDRDQSRRPTQE